VKWEERTCHETKLLVYHLEIEEFATFVTLKAFGFGKPHIYLIEELCGKENLCRR
jgi:hypothetical protein